MRLRPIGPGIGGLNYTQMLEHTQTLKSASALPASRTEDRPGRLHAVWLAVKATGKVCAQRVKEARMAEARRYIAEYHARRRLEDRSDAGGLTGSRYY